MRYLILILAIIQSLLCNAQVANKEIRKGNKEYSKKAYNDAEIDYRKALDKKPDLEIATYNLADALYKEGQFEPSITKFESLTKTKANSSQLSKYYYNLGNSYFKTQKMEDAINAYKQSLRLNPKDQDAKHNLFLAQHMQKQQQKQQQQKENQKNQDKKDQKNQENKQKQDQQKEQQQKEQDQQQGKEQQISKEDAERLLEALEQDEKEVIKKVEEKKMQVRKVPAEKEW